MGGLRDGGINLAIHREETTSLLLKETAVIVLFISIRCIPKKLLALIFLHAGLILLKYLLVLIV